MVHLSQLRAIKIRWEVRVPVASVIIQTETQQIQQRILAIIMLHLQWEGRRAWMRTRTISEKQHSNVILIHIDNKNPYNI